MRSLDEEVYFKIDNWLSDMFFCRDNADEVPTLRSLIAKIEESGIHGSSFSDAEKSWLNDILSDIEGVWGLKKSIKAAYVHLRFAVPISKEQIARKTVLGMAKKYWFKLDKRFYDAA